MTIGGAPIGGAAIGGAALTSHGRALVVSGSGHLTVGGATPSVALVSRSTLTASATVIPAAELHGMSAADLRDLARRLWALVYAGLSNPAVHGLLTLLGVLISAAACQVAVDAYEQDRDHNAIEQETSAPPIVVQPAPVTVIPDQREIDRRVDERLRQLGVNGGSGDGR